MDFTPSERVEIGKRVEAKLAGRKGSNQYAAKVDVQNFAHADAGAKTRELAAQKAGFGNAETYRQAKTVVEHGAPSLVEAMDRGDVSVSASALEMALKSADLIPPCYPESIVPEISPELSM